MRSHILIILTFLFSLATVSIAQATKTETKKIAIGLASNFSDVSSSSSNPYGNYFNDGVILALSENEQKLKANGLEVILQKFDYGSGQTKVIETVNKAINSEVIGVLGYNLSSQALIAAPLHYKAKLPMITPSATARRLNTFDHYIHMTCFDNEFMGNSLARLAINEFNAKKVAIVVAVDCAYCQDLSSSFKAEFEKKGKSVKIYEVLDSDVDFTSIAKNIKADGKYDAILVPNNEMNAAKIIAAISAEDIKLPFLGGDGWGNVGTEFFGILKQTEFDGLTVSHWNKDDPNPSSVEFVRKYIKNFGKEPNDTAVLAYDSMSYLLNVILTSNSFTRLDLEKALAEDRNFHGATGDFIFKSGKGPQKSLVVLKAKSQKFKYLKTLRPNI